MTDATRYELDDGSSSKFWTISVDGKSHTVRYGRIGTTGQSNIKTFESADAAASSAQKLIEQKTKKGYKPAIAIDVPILGNDIRIVSTYEEEPIDASHPAIKLIGKWSTTLKSKIAKACFRHYQDMVDSIGLTRPKINEPSQVWQYITINSIRLEPDVKDIAVVYAVPDWDKENHMEWAIKGTGTLLYAGTFLFYGVGSYADQNGFE